MNDLENYISNQGFTKIAVLDGVVDAGKALGRGFNNMSTDGKVYAGLGAAGGALGMRFHRPVSRGMAQGYRGITGMGSRLRYGRARSGLVGAAIPMGIKGIIDYGAGIDKGTITGLDAATALGYAGAGAGAMRAFGGRLRTGALLGLGAKVYSDYKNKKV